MIKICYEGEYKPRLLELEKHVEDISQIEGTVNVKVVPSQEVRRLNKDFAANDYATDVLSFSYIEGGDSSSYRPGLSVEGQPDTPELGDVVISSEHIVSQARRAGTDEETEFVLLLLHGLLHILGFDHQTEADKRRMDKLQKDIMSKMGLVYRSFGWRAS